MDILQLFPTPVGISTLKRDLTEEEIKIIEDLKKDIHTNYGGGMSGGNTAASGIVTGGYIYPSTGPATASEEFTNVTETATAKTLTTS